ncbi:hypothetical protein COV81_00295 [Candidatus Peregrinibacteria bacterium CG11_big_fil_rev_8_21_14_0_20_41_10]|nr:MAG: hypothetical protein COV81_00295 [Candidatus Peregrinibacteria bacterium CG11_big_fil_rev_8_21_14_0_20_41_10]PIZ76377.1 MAG: hypothetical protein COY06_01965 [Candidatus Peregrinibacteria bacterium CG_4_10_14_0_2_um_filter_41_8]PJC38252.1 MAG: hypothetical protein CO045_01250 [Candidatus Peregrinibacteria bacterium CG_4_9_14_0_2_um_filter_41_14]
MNTPIIPPTPPTGDTYSYKGWLNSDSFLKRSFAILGYESVARLILIAGGIAIALVFAIVAWGSGAFFN